MQYRGNSLEQFWMPFTANRDFKAQPRMVSRASGVYLYDQNDSKIIDGSSGLFCSPAGHCHPKIIEAVNTQLKQMTYVPPFGSAHDGSFALAERISRLTPDGINHVFFVNSGSEAIDTALKIAVGYHRLRGEGTRTRFIGRERSYHGVNIGGTSIGGVGPNRKAYSGILLPGVDHLRHTHDPKRAFTRGCAQSGAELADELEERIVPLHDASNIAAVIVEPMSGSAGVLVPPVGYLQRLREICTQHNILLIFDEVITGFRFGFHGYDKLLGIEPDLTTLGKIVGGGLPVAAVLGRRELLQQLAPLGPVYQAGTMAGNPVCLAAGIATLTELAEGGVYRHLDTLGKHLDAAFARHSLKSTAQLLRVGPIVWPYFDAAAPLPVAASSIAAPAVNEYHRRYRGWLARGVYLPPSAYEVCFLSAAHTADDLDKLLDVLSMSDPG